MKVRLTIPAGVPLVMLMGTFPPGTLADTVQEGQGDALRSSHELNVAEGRPVVSRAGGVTWKSWGNADDSVDFNKTTRGGRWGNETNAGGGTFQVVDLGDDYTLTGVGYGIDWDGAFKNDLTVVIQVSRDMKTWVQVARVVHRYSETIGTSKADVDLSLHPTRARFVKFWEPPDGEWNGWGDLFGLRAFAEGAHTDRGQRPQISYP